MADNENEVSVAETQKTDDDKTEAGTDGKLDTDKDGEDTAKETKYDSDEFETESESGVPKTDEEKYAEKSKADSPENEDTEVKTDDEKLGNEQQTEDTKEENGESVPLNTETNTEMSEAGETKTEERQEDAQTADQQEEPKTEQEQDDVTADGEANAESSNQEGETQQDQDQATSEKEQANEAEEAPADEDKTESGQDEVDKEDNEAVPVEAGSPIEKEKLDSKIKENEELSQKLESSLSNQEADKAAYQKLTEENARLQKHHDDMKEKFEDMEGGHVVLVAEVETLRKVNHEQREAIVKLESEIKLLKETQGGDDNIKDMQEKLIRLSNEQEEKDRRIHSLEGELDATREKLKDAESNAARGGNDTAKNSKTCIIM